MARPQWLELEPKDQDAFRTAVAFLEDRMGRVDTFEWALSKAASNKVIRIAILHLLDTPLSRPLEEPWSSAWRYVEEFWKDQPCAFMEHGVGEHYIRTRLVAGERSGVLVRELVDLVTPRLNITSNAEFRRRHPKKAVRPKRVSDLFSATLTSGRAIDLDVLKLKELTDVAFLVSLGDALDAAIGKGLAIARRFGWQQGHELWRLGRLHRVYYVVNEDRVHDEHEPDEFHEGIAPSVKLLYAVVERLIEVDVEAGLQFTNRWKGSHTFVYLRLWAALARNEKVASAAEVASFLAASSDEVFWLTYNYPEVAELRARRFKDLTIEDKKQLTTRVRRLPPKSIWPRESVGEALKREKVLSAVRELQRIKVAGSGDLGIDAEKWLDESAKAYARTDYVERVDDKFPATGRADWVRPDPDSKFDELVGEARLDAMDEALALSRERWDLDPAQQAADWLQQPHGLTRILGDLESAKATRRGTAALWERFGWAHKPQDAGTGVDSNAEAERVLSLLVDLPEDVIASAIDGITHWLSSWQGQVVSTTLGRSVWSRVWPIAMTTTNSRRAAVDRLEEDNEKRAVQTRESMDMDSLNTPVGKLVGVFLAGCPNLSKVKTPFARGRSIRAMRDTIIGANDQALLIVRYRLLSFLRYFLIADQKWARKTLVQPLLAKSSESDVLWSALGRQVQFKRVLEEIGAAMLERALDLNLDRETRQAFARSVVVECLHALLENRNPVVAQSGVQQLLRAVEEEVRSIVAGVFAEFVEAISSSKERGISAKDVFTRSAAVFLRRVWPQETSLTTTGVSRAFTRLPAASGAAFADAVDSIERFLVPFDAWSMLDYGLYGDKEGQPKLHLVANSKMAEAFLRLLDKTIGIGDRAVVPYDLATALSHIQSISPELAESSSFRRLGAMARR